MSRVSRRFMACLTHNTYFLTFPQNKSATTTNKSSRNDNTFCYPSGYKFTAMELLPVLLLIALIAYSNAFAPSHNVFYHVGTQLLMAEADAAAPLISGADLEMMLTEWDQPLVVDAYAT